LENAKEAGNAAFKVGRCQEAIDAYTQALELDPSNNAVNAKLYSNRATASAKLGRHQEAIADCDKALELDADFFKVYLRRADCYMKTEKFEEAVRDYEKASGMERQNHGSRRLMIFIHATEVQQALRDAKKALKMASRKDLYKILGVSKDASDGEIKKAYRKMALLHHPGTVMYICIFICR
jgi:DnaJ family protein C protein 7